MMSDTQYEWLTEKLGETIVLALRSDIRAMIHADNRGDEVFSHYKLGELNGYLRGLSDGGVADYLTLQQFKSKMYQEESFKIAKEQDDERDAK